MFYVGFNSFDEESSCFMWVLMLFGCPELQRVMFHVGFNSFAPEILVFHVGSNVFLDPRARMSCVSCGF